MCCFVDFGWHLCTVNVLLTDASKHNIKQNNKIAYSGQPAVDYQLQQALVSSSSSSSSACLAGNSFHWGTSSISLQRLRVHQQWRVCDVQEAISKLLQASFSKRLQSFKSWSFIYSLFTRKSVVGHILKARTFATWKWTIVFS